jgi:hypothetical protein
VVGFLAAGALEAVAGFGLALVGCATGLAARVDFELDGLAFGFLVGLGGRAALGFAGV